MNVAPAFPYLSFQHLTHLTDAGDGTHRLFAVLQEGLVVAFPNVNTETSAKLFLDLREQVNASGSEEGLLGLAFDPHYRTSGYFYVNYTAYPPRRSVISRFSVSADDPNRADPTSEVVILEVLQPYANHNGGHLVFGPDGYLYVGLGDGGSGGDPHGNGQNRTTLLGSILRIDVSQATSQDGYRIPPDNPFVGAGGGVREEIWAYGLRNPWRFNFDPLTELLWAADVGQNDYEEVDIIKRGGNYGWNVMEGAHCFPPSASACQQSGLELPVIEYLHAGGNCSIIGGYVYRGIQFPSLYGAYLHGDYCTGKVWALRYDGSKVTEHLELADTPYSITAFGEDETGELYILTDEGGIYQFQEEP